MENDPSPPRPLAAAIMENDPSPPRPLSAALLHRSRWQPLHLLPSLSCLSSNSAGWSELGGAVGDLGTFIPIAVALTLVSHLDLGTTLIFTALYNILTGLLFDIPMPVQPMKSIAAVAISQHLSLPQVLAAGLSTGAILLLLGATGIMSFLYRFIPLPVVRGIQLSQGLAFTLSAVKYILYHQNFSTGKSGNPRPWIGLDGLIIAISSALFLILFTGSGGESSFPQEEQDGTLPGPRSRRLGIPPKIPAAFIVFLFGLFICFLQNPSIITHLKLGPSSIRFANLTWNDWKIGFVNAAIPQIPLSILNSVIAVCKLSGDLFPDRKTSALLVSVSVGVMNCVGCWFGAMPVCHGAGGLAGQYRFGGRSGWSVIYLGIGKMVLGLLLGNSFVRILEQFPVGILGVLLFFAGVELAMTSRDMSTKEESFVMLACAAVSLTGSNAALGFGCGIVLFLLLQLRKIQCFQVILNWMEKNETWLATEQI